MAEFTIAVANATSAAFAGDDKGLKKYVRTLTDGDQIGRSRASQDINRALLKMAQKGQVRLEDGSDRR